MRVAAALLAISIISSQSVTSDAIPEPELVMSCAGQSVILTVEEYVAGVVAAEMPYTFHEEALKAQAVAARTYFTYRLESGARTHDSGADVCDDAFHCCAFTTEDALAERFGEEYAAQAFAVSHAAADTTAGEIMTYGGAPIQAVWHASSDGSTASSGEIWSEVPYLAAVTSPEAPDITTAEFTMAEVEDILEGAGYIYDRKKNVRFSATESGRCAALTLGNVTLSGQEARTLFGLRSSDFAVRWRAGKLCFAVHGYGHGVGMSQRGADTMAWDGADYRAILAHYYTGTEIKPAD